MAIAIEWHPEAVADLAKISKPDRERIQKSLVKLAELDDARDRLEPYRAQLSGYWKLRIGNYRLVCEVIESKGKTVLIILVAHRSVVYSSRNQRKTQSRK